MICVHPCTLQDANKPKHGLFDVEEIDLDDLRSDSDDERGHKKGQQQQQAGAGGQGPRGPMALEELERRMGAAPGGKPGEAELEGPDNEGQSEQGYPAWSRMRYWTRHVTGVVQMRCSWTERQVVGHECMPARRDAGRCRVHTDRLPFHGSSICNNVPNKPMGSI